MRISDNLENAILREKLKKSNKKLRAIKKIIDKLGDDIFNEMKSSNGYLSNSDMVPLYDKALEKINSIIQGKPYIYRDAVEDILELVNQKLNK